VETIEWQQTSSLQEVFVVSSLVVVIQFGWTLKMSFLTPFVENNGINPAWSSFLRILGPIFGLVVQPIVGYNSYHCTPCFDRPRPFILGGVLVATIFVILIGFATDITYTTRRRMITRVHE